MELVDNFINTSQPPTKKQKLEHSGQIDLLINRLPSKLLAPYFSEHSLKMDLCRVVGEGKDNKLTYIFPEYVCLEKKNV